MILDPDNKYIEAINSHAPLAGTTVLEIGCGNGRISRDMAKFASKVVATDLNPAVLEQAKQNIQADNIDFLYTPDGIPDLPAHSFDIVIYTLSLHHIPKDKMLSNLQQSGSLLKDSGTIIVVEPDDGGSFMEVKNRFGAGSGDETEERKNAAAAMQRMEGWELSPTYHFDVAFQFTDEDDFFIHKLPNYQNMPAEKVSELKQFLKNNSTQRGIILTSGRRLNRLTRK